MQRAGSCIRSTAAVSPRIMIPSRRLPRLLEQAQKLQTSHDLFYNLANDARLSLYIDHKTERCAFPTKPAQFFPGHHDEVWHVVFSHNGKKLASVGKDKKAIVWNAVPTVEDPMLHRFGPLHGAICHAAWSPDDERLLTTSDDGEVVVWDLQTETRQDFKGHTYTVGCGCWLPDGKTIVTGGMDSRVMFWRLDGTTKWIWDTSPFRVQAIDVSPDGRSLVAISHRPGAATASHASQNVVQAGHQNASPTPSSPPLDEEWTQRRRWAAAETAEVVDLGGGSRTMTEERFQIHFYDIVKQAEVG